MGSFEFKCRECGVLFDVHGIEQATVHSIWCIECKGSDLELLSFDEGQETILIRILDEMRTINQRLDDLLDDGAEDKPEVH